jgi:prepilin peptidase CpaA
MSPNAIALATIVVGGVVGIVIDVRLRRVPNALTVSIAAIGIGLALAGAGPVGLPAALAGGALGLALMLPGYLCGATGAGDVKLLAAMGTLLGPATVVAGFLYSLIAGAVIALVVAARRGLVWHTITAAHVLVLTRGANAAAIEHPAAGNRFAYAPAIVIGVVLAAVKQQ